MTSNQMSIYYYLFEQICTWVILELTADKRYRYQEKVYANEYKRATKQTISLVLNVHVPNQERISCPNPPKNGRSRRWTIQTINEQMGIPTMNDYVSYVGETPRVDFCAQVLEKHFAIQSKIMKVPHIRTANSPPSCIMISRQESTFTSSRNNSGKDQSNENPQQNMPRQRLNSKETITYIVKEMSRMSVRSPITKIPDSGK